MKTTKDIIDKFDKEFPEFIGVGSQFPIFKETPNRQHIKQFLQSSLTSLLDIERNDYNKIFSYVQHKSNCILNDFEAGEPTEDGGYRQKIRGKWYQVSPIDETPKCDCELDEVINIINSHR